MSGKGVRVVGEKALEPKAQTLQYHWADRRGRMYLCGCFSAFRVGGRIKHAFGKRHKRSKIETDRWIALGAK